MVILFEELKDVLRSILIKHDFPSNTAEICSNIFASNTLDGVHSHGVNRFPVFIQYVQEGVIDVHANPAELNHEGAVEYWDGNLAPGMYTATLAMQRAITLARENKIGCVTVKNTNHWMRGGTYGWLAANEDCIGICATNTIANMPPWGSSEP